MEGIRFIDCDEPETELEMDLGDQPAFVSPQERKRAREADSSDDDDSSSDDDGDDGDDGDSTDIEPERFPGDDVNSSVHEDADEQLLNYRQQWDQLRLAISEMTQMDDSARLERLCELLGTPCIPRDVILLDHLFFSKLLRPALEIAEYIDYKPELGYPDFSDATMDILSRLHALYNMIQNRHTFLYGEPAVLRTTDQVLNDMAPTDLCFCSEKFRLFMWCLNQARRDRVRHMDGDVYRELYINNGMTRTHNWTRVATIDEYFPPRIHGHYNVAVLATYVEHPKYFTEIAAVLANGFSQFPRLEISREYISWADGIYSLWTDTFYPYSDDIPDDLTTYHFIDNAFAPIYQGPLDERIWPYINATNDELAMLHRRFVLTGGEFPLPDYSGMETPLFDMMMTTQEWDVYTQFWFMFMLGRLLRPLKMHDDYQVMLVLVGLARTGKSEMVRVINYFFPPEKVTQLENRMEDKFGLSNMPGKYLWVLEELGSNPSMDTNMFKKIIDGAPMQISEKHKTAKDNVRLESHGIITTNTDIGQTGALGRNTQGSVPRRLIQFPYRCRAPQDKFIPEISKEIQKSGELPSVLRKCNLSYMIGKKIIDQMFRGDIWMAMPRLVQDEYFNMMLYTEDLLHFLMTDQSIMLGPECVCRVSEIRRMFLAWQQQQPSRHRSVPWNDASTQATFDILKCKAKSTSVSLNTSYLENILSEADVDYTVFDEVRGLHNRLIPADKFKPHVISEDNVQEAAGAGGSGRRRTPALSNDYIFGIAIGNRRPRRVIPSFIQRMLVPTDDPSEYLTFDDVEKFIDVYRRDWYRNETQFCWDEADFVAHCAHYRIRCDAETRTIGAKIR